MVLDFDPGHDMAALGANLGERLKPTALRVRTRKGGEHWYYDPDADKHGVYETIRLSATRSRRRWMSGHSTHTCFSPLPARLMAAT